MESSGISIPSGSNIWIYSDIYIYIYIDIYIYIYMYDYIYIWDYMSVSPSSSILDGTCAGSQLQTIANQTSGRGPSLLSTSLQRCKHGDQVCRCLLDHPKFTVVDVLPSWMNGGGRPKISKTSYSDVCGYDMLWHHAVPFVSFFRETEILRHHWLAMYADVMLCAIKSYQL